jgi:hypothetical protein
LASSVTKNPGRAPVARQAQVFVHILKERKMFKTRFDYTVNGNPQSEVADTPSVFAYNNAVDRLFAIADKDSIRATSV